MFSDPQFWVAISFILFILAIFRPVKKILAENLDIKINEIKNKINEAENLKTEAQKTLSELKKREAEVENEIRKFKDDTSEKIKNFEITSVDRLNEQINKRKILAENKIDQMLREANMSIKIYISNISIETVNNLLQTKLTDDKRKTLIETSIKELNTVIKN
tara:strand:+ start:165 stop:650 length:486 start_codon:yes stop_codon:yes gene_type:complete